MSEAVLILLTKGLLMQRDWRKNTSHLHCIWKTDQSSRPACRHLEQTCKCTHVPGIDSPTSRGEQRPQQLRLWGWQYMQVLFCTFFNLLKHTWLPSQLETHAFSFLVKTMRKLCRWLSPPPGKVYQTCSGASFFTPKISLLNSGSAQWFTYTNTYLLKVFTQILPSMPLNAP